MRKLIKRKKGQVLVISLVALVALFIVAVLVVEIGNVMYEKIHMQNIADSGAMEGGMWYARSLNVIALSNKALVMATAGGLVMIAINPPLFTEPVRKGLETLQLVQNVFAGTGKAEVDLRGVKFKIAPLFVFSQIFVNGISNDADYSVGIFNIEESDNNFHLPSFNVKRRSLKDFLEKIDISELFGDFGNDIKQEDIYYYESGEGKDKKTVFTDKSNAIEQEEKKKDGTPMYRDGASGKYISHATPVPNPEKEFSKGMQEGGALQKIAKNFPLDITEAFDEPHHSILVVSGKTKGRLKQVVSSNFFKKDEKEIKPGFPFAGLMAFSYVEIIGGSLDFWELNKVYYPVLKHVNIPDLAVLEKVGNMASAVSSKSGKGNIDGSLDLSSFTKLLSDMDGFIEENIILH